MTNRETTIGILSSFFERKTLCTLGDFDEFYVGQNRYTADEYCDFRYSTNLQRFKYDPFTGEEIDWKEVKRILLEF